MPNMEELLNQISVEITRDRTLQLFMSKIDLDYAYGQMKLSEETSRQCVFALSGRNFSGYYQFKKRFYGLADIPTIFQEKTDRTLEYCTPAWLDDIIVVTRGSKQDHEKQLFDVLNKLEKLTEPGQELEIDFTGKLHNKNIHGDVQILIAVDRFSRWPTVKICKTSETKEVIQFLSNNFNLYGIPEKIKSDKGGAFISKEYREFCKSRNIEIEYCTPRIHTGNGTVERAIQTLKNLVIANMEDGENLTGSVNRALRVMRFTVHTGLEKTPFELHHGRKPRTELTNIVKDGKTYLSDWSELSHLAPTQPKISIYVGRDADGKITNHIVMARTKAEEKQTAGGVKSPKK